MTPVGAPGRRNHVGHVDAVGVGLGQQVVAGAVVSDHADQAHTLIELCNGHRLVRALAAEDLLAPGRVGRPAGLGHVVDAQDEVSGDLPDHHDRQRLHARGVPDPWTVTPRSPRGAPALWIDGVCGVVGGFLTGADDRPAFRERAGEHRQRTRGGGAAAEPAEAGAHDE